MAICQTLLRLGLSDSTELRLSLPSYPQSFSRIPLSGVTDISIGFLPPCSVDQKIDAIPPTDQAISQLSGPGDLQERIQPVTGLIGNQVDFHFGFGLSSSTPHSFFAFGYSFRVDRLWGKRTHS
jgi:hypothetical protein